ncbi:MAG TPA: glucose-6-phosphate isomerase [Candidatus Polarisedimenticolia bacterium]|jgi:glucose-6-phosphate isomerase
MPGADPTQELDLGSAHEKALRTRLRGMQGDNLIARLLARDPTLWKEDPEHARVVKNRMGWLDAAGRTLLRLEEIESFVREIRREGVRNVVLLGMGGSSLCPDVLRRTFRRKPGFPSLLVLDSTDPQAIAGVDRRIDPGSALFIVASKSGTTLESQVFHQYFARKAPPDHFAAITDPGTPLETMGREQGFRRVFLNPPDIGGRYSALSCFGMVPAACLGIDIAELLRRGDRMARTLAPGVPIEACAPVVLGAALGTLAAAGRDKVTFVASERIAGFGYWVEQLIAESTGKEGKGLVPVEGEPLGPPAIYRKDRVFVHLVLRGAKDAVARRRLAALRRAGHPVITIRLEDPFDLGAEFNRWEIATAVAGSILGINPFDEPNVRESKDNTGRVLQEYKATGILPSFSADIREGEIQAWVSGLREHRGLKALLGEICQSAKPGDYIALMAWLPMEEPIRKALGRIRVRLRERSRAATTLGFGPRFLHSTGQLHKGGAGNGIFLQITAAPARDVSIPGESYSFGVLEAAQAAGDYLSLASRGYRVARLHLGTNKLKGLEALLALT